jgi:hypothetical protein
MNIYDDRPSVAAAAIAPSEVPSPSREAVLAARNLAFDAIIEHCSLAESFALSAGEAAWRGDELTVRTHLRQLRLCVIASLQTFNDELVGAGGS